jgi:putative hydrolase of the HAD superfamily
LFLERDYVRSGFSAVGTWAAARFGVEGFADRAYRYFLAGRRGDIFDAVLDELGCKAQGSEIQQMLNVYRQHEPVISLLEDAAEFLEFCQGEFVLALISDGPFDSQSRKLRALQIERFFAEVVLTDRWPGAGKPDPLAFRLIEERLGGDGMQFCYVADNVKKDFQAPRRLGWSTVRVRREHGLYASLEPAQDAKPHYEISNLSELKHLLLL